MGREDGRRYAGSGAVRFLRDNLFIEETGLKTVRAVGTVFCFCVQPDGMVGKSVN